MCSWETAYPFRQQLIPLCSWCIVQIHRACPRAKVPAALNPTPPTRAHAYAHAPTRTHPREKKRESKPLTHAHAHTHIPTRARTRTHTHAHTWAHVYLSNISFAFCSFRKCYFGRCLAQKIPRYAYQGRSQFAKLPLFCGLSMVDPSFFFYPTPPQTLPLPLPKQKKCTFLKNYFRSVCLANTTFLKKD